MKTNLQAFLDTLAWSEGTDNGKQKTNDRGYDVLVGGGLFHTYTDHPRKSVRLNRTLWSTAAGRYQILARYYDSYKRTLGLKDFSPASQDAIAIQMIREQKALADIEAGRFDVAVVKCNNIWASLPGNSYGQFMHPLEALRKVYKEKLKG